MKTITQNGDRYSKVGTDWNISASPNIKPLKLSIGVPLNNIKPVINADGIVVKVGENYLCSPYTLNEIKQSNNPHYDIIQNGEIKVKDKTVVIGKTIKIIELDIDRLDGLIESRKFMNKQSGVLNVTYVNDRKKTIEGIPVGLINQINYTLTQSGQRPADEYQIIDYYAKVNPKTNPSAAHYTIQPLRIVTDQKETIFDPKKLQEFLIGLDNQLALLRKDFNWIKQTFFDGIIEEPLLSGILTEKKIARTDVDDVETDHSYKITQSKLISIETPPVSQVQDNLTKSERELQANIQQNALTLQQKALDIENQLRRAQSGDAAAQQGLAIALMETRRQLAEVQKKLPK